MHSSGGHNLELPSTASEAPLTCHATNAFSRRSADVALLAVRPTLHEPCALPDTSFTVPLAETVHRALVKRAARGRRVDCPELTGHDRFGQPLTSGHLHAHICPLDLDRDTRLDHVLVWAHMGLGSTARRGLFSLRRIWHAASGRQFSVAPVAVRLAPAECTTAVLRTFSAATEDAHRLLRSLVPSGRGTAVWSSLTPFVAPRYEKPRGPNSLVGQVQAELASRRLPPARSVAILPARSKRLQPLVRARSCGRRPPVQRGYALRIELERPVVGPLALGYAAHFGLGLFAADALNPAP